MYCWETSSGIGVLLPGLCLLPAPAIPTPALLSPHQFHHPFPGCSSLFSPLPAPAISNRFTPESARKSESNLPPAGAAGDFGFLGTQGFCACRKATGHKQGALHPSWALHWFCWCLRKSGTRDKEHEGFGLWLEPGAESGGEFSICFLISSVARPCPWSWDRRPGTWGLVDFLGGAWPLSAAPLEGPQAMWEPSSFCFTMSSCGQ